MPSNHSSKRAILYARVSTDEQARSGYSLAQQIEALRQYAANEGYEVLEEVTEPGQSGASLERPGMDRVRNLVAEGGVSVVLSQDRDRFAREPAYHYLLKREFGEYGTKLKALNDRGDGSPEGELTDGILDQLAKFERAKTAERTRRGRLRKARQGKIVAASPRATYGFRYNATRDGYLLEEESMRVVRRIFRMIGEGCMTLRTVARTLERDGVPPPNGGRWWNTQTIRDIILDDCYKPHTFEEIEQLVNLEVAARLDADKSYGVSWYNRRRVTKRQVPEDGPEGRRYRKVQKISEKPRGEWIAVPVPDSGVPRSLVDLARDRIKDNIAPKKVASKFWELSGGIIHCGSCGRRLDNQRTRKGVGDGYHHYYRCRTRHRYGPESCSLRGMRRADKIEAQVWEAVSGLMKDPEQLRSDLQKVIDHERRDSRGEPQREAKVWLGKLTEVDRKRSGFQDMAAEGLISLDELRIKLVGLEELRNTAQRELDTLASRQERFEALERDKEAILESYARMAPEALDGLTPEERHQFYRMLRLRVIVEPDGATQISGAFNEAQLCGHQKPPQEETMRAEDVEGLTVGGLLDLVAERRPDDDALVYPDRDLRHSYRKFREVVEGCARALMALGLRKGGHVAVWGQNVPEWVILQFATGKMGAVLVTVNPAYKAQELKYVLDQSNAAALFLTSGVKDADFIEILGQAVPEIADTADGELSVEELPHLRHVVLMGEGDRRGLPIMTFEEFVERGTEVSPEDLDERQDSLDAGEVINMQYTSGTTGFPKGVQLSHANIVKNAFYIGECMELGPEDQVCIPVPFFHCFGCVLGTLNTVTHEGTMVPVEQFDPEKVLQAVHEERCTAVLGVPTMFIAELEHPDFEEYDTSSLRTGIMAGSPCPMEVMKQVVDVMGASEITIAYGQTESSPVITQTRTKDPLELRVSTVGRVLPETEVRIVDVGTGEDCSPGEQGELWTRGYLVMKGYYKMEDKTREVIDEEGWLHTGDLAVMDENGYVKITGRAKDMIIRGGENVYPREIEEFLYTHPDISDVQVYGVPDEKYGEQVAAAVKKRQGSDLTEEDVKEFCRENIARYKVPFYVDFVEEYPMTASGKIQKYRLREAAVERHGLREAAEVETA